MGVTGNGCYCRATGPASYLPLPPQTGSLCGVEAPRHSHRIQDWKSPKIAWKVGECGKYSTNGSQETAIIILFQQD